MVQVTIFFHADRVAIINVWAYLYGLYKQPEMLERSKWVLNAHLYASNYKKGTDVRFADNPAEENGGRGVMRCTWLLRRLLPSGK